MVGKGLNPSALCARSTLHYYRQYALRRTRDYFREKKALTDVQEIRKEFQFGLQQLEMLRRQVCELYAVFTTN